MLFVAVESDVQLKPITECEFNICCDPVTVAAVAESVDSGFISKFGAGDSTLDAGDDELGAELLAEFTPLQVTSPTSPVFTEAIPVPTVDTVLALLPILLTLVLLTLLTLLVGSSLDPSTSKPVPMLFFF